MKRLALLWLVCAAVGFAVAASAAAMIALALDRAPSHHSHAMAAPPTRSDVASGPGAPTNAYTGERLLGD